MHAQISYHPVPQDLHQRCALPPSLWSLITLALLCGLGEAGGPEWVSEQVTMFAENLFESWKISSRADVDQAPKLIGRTFAILQSLGLQVQNKKTLIMLSLRGRLARKWLSSYTTKTKDGVYLNIPGPDARVIQVPVVTEIKYLGTLLGCGDFEMAIVKYRIGCAAASHSRLARILHSRSLSLPKRLALWRTRVCLCVCALLQSMDFMLSDLPQTPSQAGLFSDSTGARCCQKFCSHD